MLGFSSYNYDRFTRQMFERHQKAGFPGPLPGERAPDFELRTLEGEEVRLSDFRGLRNVVLTFGSATCPMTAGSISGLKQLYEDFRDQGEVEFLFVYVREAHPGNLIRAHRSLDDKIEAAEFFRDEEDVDLPILLDDLKGKVHRAYSATPNPSYVIDRSGRVAFRMMWTQPSVLSDALEELLERQQERGSEHAVVAGGEDLSLPISYPVLYSHRALERGGHKAIEDFREAMGFPGRVLLASSRAAQPVRENPGIALAALGIMVGVLAGSLLAGKLVREHRRPRGPYDVHPVPPKRERTGTEYGVGI